MRLFATLLVVATLPALAQPVDYFFRLPQYATMAISPDGEHVAALSPVNGRQNVVVFDLKTMNPKAVTSFSTRDIVQVQWINNKRLLARSGSLREQAADARGGGLYAVDRDGASGRLVAEGGPGEQIGGGVRYTYRPMQVVRIPAGGSDDIIAQEQVLDVAGRSKAGALYRVNTRTGARTSLSDVDGDSWQYHPEVQRVCIYGASYGGYATMMGLAKHPELYRCGINYVGVTDLELFLSATWSDYAQSDALQYSMKDMVGDLSRDAKRIKETSPVEQAGRIKAPVLMAYGGQDFRVPIEHGMRMKSALERQGNAPIWIVADGEGHGFRDMQNIKLFYEAMEKFLKEHLGT